MKRKNLHQQKQTIESERDALIRNAESRLE